MNFVSNLDSEILILLPLLLLLLLFQGHNYVKDHQLCQPRLRSLSGSCLGGSSLISRFPRYTPYWMLNIISLYIIFLIANEISFYKPLTNAVIQHETITTMLRHSIVRCWNIAWNLRKLIGHTETFCKYCLSMFIW